MVHTALFSIVLSEDPQSANVAFRVDTCSTPVKRLKLSFFRSQMISGGDYFHNWGDVVKLSSQRKASRVSTEACMPMIETYKVWDQHHKHCWQQNSCEARKPNMRILPECTLLPCDIDFAGKVVPEVFRWASLPLSNDYDDMKGCGNNSTMCSSRACLCLYSAASSCLLSSPPPLSEHQFDGPMASEADLNPQQVATMELL